MTILVTIGLGWVVLGHGGHIFHFPLTFAVVLKTLWHYHASV